MSSDKELYMGRRLKQLMEERNFTREALSRKMGVSYATASRLTGQSEFNTGTIKEICKVFNISFIEFFITEEALAEYFSLNPETLTLARQIESLPKGKQEQLIRLFSDAIEIMRG